MKVIRELPKNSAGPPPDLSRTGGSEAMCVNSCSLGLRMRNFLRSGSEGAAILEFALVLPLLLLLLTGIFSVTMALITYEKIGEAAFVGAQVFQNDRGMLGATGDPCAAAQTQTATVLSGWNSSLITYTVAITDAAGTAQHAGLLDRPRFQ